jgi:hypothetical protein
MAGLLDIFGTGGVETMGLLGMSPEDTQKSRDSAQAQALYALAGRLFQGGRGASSVLEGLQQGRQAYQQAMQGGLQEQLQKAQLKEMLRKRQEEQIAKQQQLQAQQVLAKAYRPEIFADTPLMDMMGQEVAGPNQPQTAGGGLKAVQRELMGLGPAGMAALQTASGVEKALRPEAYTLSEGQVRYEDGKPVATGAPKVAKLTGKEGNVALMFYGTDDVAKLREIPNAIDKIRVEATTQRKAEQPQINLNDPTAVQTQQLKTINQWEGVLKDSGAAETAMRAQGFYAAYEQAKKGNANADGAMIYNLAKVYDPSGAVQASDVSTVLGSRSVPDNIKMMADKLVKGGTLTPKERDNMKKIIDNVTDERSRMIAPSLKTYRDINKSLGGNESAINNPFELVKKPADLNEILGFGRPRGGQ